MIRSPCIHIDISPPTRHQQICSRCESAESLATLDPTDQWNCCPISHIHILRNQIGFPNLRDIIILPAKRKTVNKLHQINQQATKRFHTCIVDDTKGTQHMFLL